MFLRFRLRKAEEEVERLQAELADAEENMEELEEEVEALMDSRAKMRVEIHEAHCQVRACARVHAPRGLEPPQASNDAVLHASPNADIDARSKLGRCQRSPFEQKVRKLVS